MEKFHDQYVKKVYAAWSAKAVTDVHADDDVGRSWDELREAEKEAWRAAWKEARSWVSYIEGR